MSSDEVRLPLNLKRAKFLMTFSQRDINTDFLFSSVSIHKSSELETPDICSISLKEPMLNVFSVAVKRWPIIRSLKN